MGIIRSVPEEWDTPAGEELKWLTRYAVRGTDTTGAVIEMDDPVELHRVIARTVRGYRGADKRVDGRCRTAAIYKADSQIINRR